MQRSVGALPFCTSAPQVVSDCALCALDPVAFPDFYFLEIRGNHFYSGRVTHEDHLFCQIFGMKVEVKNTPVIVRD